MSSAAWHSLQSPDQPPPHAVPLGAKVIPDPFVVEAAAGAPLPARVGLQPNEVRLPVQHTPKAGVTRGLGWADCPPGPHSALTQKPSEGQDRGKEKRRLQAENQAL